MNACAILETLQREGIAVRREGDVLKLKPATGAIPADLIELARASKSELLAALPDTSELQRQRTRLLTAARAVGVPEHVIRELPDSEIPGCELLTDAGIRRFAQIVLENWLVARGVTVLFPTDPLKDLARYRATHPDSPPTKGASP